jgi:Cu/Zn superoxide dismutase
MNLQKLVLVSLLAACGDAGAPPIEAVPPGGPATPAPTAPHATTELVAPIAGTPDHPEVKGTVRFRLVGGQVEVRSEMTGLPPGSHAHHVHVNGDCSNPAGGSAGPHFDFATLSGGATREGNAGLGPNRGSTPTGPGGIATTTGTSTASPEAAASGGEAPKGNANTKGMGDQPGQGTSAGGAGHSAGSLGDLTALAGAPTRATTRLDLDHLGALSGRSVMVHTAPDSAGTSAPLGCGVIGPAEAAAGAAAPGAGLTGAGSH